MHIDNSHIHILTYTGLAIARSEEIIRDNIPKTHFTSHIIINQLKCLLAKPTKVIRALTNIRPKTVSPTHIQANSTNILTIKTAFSDQNPWFFHFFFPPTFSFSSDLMNVNGESPTELQQRYHFHCQLMAVVYHLLEHQTPWQSSR